MASDLNGLQIEHFLPTSNIQFHCNDCLASTSQPSSSLNDSVTTPKSKSITIKGIMQEVTKLQEQFASFQTSNIEMNQKLDSIEMKTTEIKSNTEVVLCQVNSKPTNTNDNTPIIFGSPSLSTRQFRPALNRKAPTWSSVLRGNGNGSQFSTPTRSAKRSRTDKPIQQIKKPNVPEPKIGTNVNASRLVAVSVAKPVSKKVEKPKFEKAIWVSRLPTATKEEDVRDYISGISSVSSNLSIHKLVKKGRDCSELNFISFKIAVNEADFVILNDPSVWPTGVLVREFMEVKPITFADHLPINLNGKNARNSTEESIAMEIQMQQQSPSKSPGAANTVS